MSSIITPAVDHMAQLRASFDEAEAARIATMEKVMSRFLHTERYDHLNRQFNAALSRLTIRHDPSKAAGIGNRIEARALLVLGESGAGKTLALRRIFTRNTAFPGYGIPKSGCQIITVNVRAPATFMAVGRELLAQTGYPIAGRLESHLTWERVYLKIEERGIMVVHFDEMHNVVLTANKNDRLDIQNTIKTLMTRPQWPVVVVVSGLPLLKPFIEEAAEDRRRVKVINFKALQLPDDIEIIDAMLSGRPATPDNAAIIGLAEIGGLTLPMGFTPHVLPRLIHAALKQLGTTMELIHEAIEEALTDKDTVLTHFHFAAAYAARTGCSEPANPFLSADWATIDCSRVLATDNLPPDPEEDENPQPKSRRTRSS